LMIVHKNLFEGFKLLQEQVLLTLNLEEKNTHTERMLIEISTAFANLSTIKSLRRTMVQHGTISTLLSMYQVGIKQVQNICATTLHRLSLETEAKVEQGLIQSLLSILQESDVALHHVRYECEKISLITSRPFPLNHQIGASTCIKQNYRDPKWILFALETTLSCHPMVPELEQKSIKTIGVPRISFLDRNQKISNLTCTKKGYLLYVDMEKKFVRSGGQILDDKVHTTKTTGSIKHENDVAFQSKKFDRHMRITRRNYRKNPTFLPVISLV
jgi:hypothetical protein